MKPQFKILSTNIFLSIIYLTLPKVIGEVYYFFAKGKKGELVAYVNEYHMVRQLCYPFFVVMIGYFLFRFLQSRKAKTDDASGGWLFSLIYAVLLFGAFIVFFMM